MTRGVPKSRRRAVTLLEISLAMGLLVVVSSMTYWFYAAALTTRQFETERARQLRLARAVLDRMVEEIRQTSSIATNRRVGLRGEAERIWLSTVRVPPRDLLHFGARIDAPPNPQTDLVKVEYKTARHPDILHEEGWERSLGLARVELDLPRRDSAETGAASKNRRVVEVTSGPGDNAHSGEGADPAKDAEDRVSEFDAMLEDELRDEMQEARSKGLGPDVNWEELYAPEILFLRFCYFDGNKWWNDWRVEGEAALPQLVQVTIGFEERAPFGEEFGQEQEDFCECLNEEALQDCRPLEPDQLTAVVRIPQSDPLFRSRMTRETHALIEDLSGGSDEEPQEGEP